MHQSSPRIYYCWIILTVATLVVFASLGLARFGYTVILPEMQKSLMLDNTQAGLLATANLIGYLSLSAIGGALASHFGPKPVISAGLLLVGISMVLTGFVTEFRTACILRALTGIGSGASNVPVMGLLAGWFASKRRGFAAGIAVTGSSLGLIFIGPLVPQIISVYGGSGWRICWIIFGAVAILLSVCSFVLLKNQPDELGIAPMDSEAEHAALFEKQKKMTWKNVYGNVSVWNLGLIYAAFGFSYIIYMTFFTKHLITTGGYSQEEAGHLFMIMGWLSLLCGLIWGSVSDVIGRRKALIIVFLIHSLSFSLFGIWPKPMGFILSSILFGLSAWSIPAIMAAFCGDILGPRLAPATLGFITLLFGIGQALGPGVAGALADNFGSFVPAFYLAGGVALFGAIASFLYRPVKTD